MGHPECTLPFLAFFDTGAKSITGALGESVSLVISPVFLLFLGCFDGDERLSPLTSLSTSADFFRLVQDQLRFR